MKLQYAHIILPVQKKLFSKNTKIKPKKQQLFDSNISMNGVHLDKPF